MERMNVKTRISLPILAVIALAAPIWAQGVKINECFTGVPDYCEIANLSAASVDVSGWSVVMTDDPTVVTTFTFPAGTILAPNEVILIREAAGPAVPPGVRTFQTGNINWAGTTSGSPGGGCGLNDAGGAGIDRVVWANGTNLPVQNPLSPFTGAIPVQNNYARNSSTDTDDASDWSSQPESPGVLNAGQPPIMGGTITADFTAGLTTVVVGGSVQFSDISSGVATMWDWDLDGDGSSDSTSQNPSFVYNTVGVFDVTLTASNMASTDTITKVGFVTVVPTLTTISENFDGPLGAEWSLSSEPNGRIRLFSDPGNVPASPGSGGNALVMDVITDQTFATNRATLTMDLAANNGGILTYWAYESNDEDHPEDGLFLSDGVTEVQVFNHNSIPNNSWTMVTVDLGAEASQAGLTLTSNFEIIFSQRDNFTAPTDGLWVDDVLIIPPPPADIGQPNEADAFLDVNSGINLRNRAAIVGEPGPFFSDGNALDITVMGNPNQPFMIFMGPLNRNNRIIAGVGSLDIGMMGLQQNYSDLLLVINGLDTTGLFNPFAKTGPNGVSQISFGLPGVPLGTLGTLQAVVFTGDASVVGLTAATEFTVTP